MKRRTGRRHPIWSLIVVAIIPAVALTSLWQVASYNITPVTTTTTTMPFTPQAALPTGLLSMRRSATLIAERVAKSKAQTDWDTMLTSLTATVASGSCLRIVRDGEVLVDLGGDPVVIPASNQKLFVAAVAIDVLGLAYTFRTEAHGAAAVNGVITGDVYLVGGGDPLLRTSDVVDSHQFPTIYPTSLEALADQFVTMGVLAITGDLVGDGSRYDDEFRAPSWTSDVGNFDAGPIDALLVNDGLMSGGNYGLNPNRSAATVFVALLEQRGISVAGAAANRPMPSDPLITNLGYVESSPLAFVLVEMLHTSDNNTAEMLLKEIGFVASGQGSRPAGLDVIRSSLTRWGIPIEGLLLHDGSGLSLENRTTCATLLALIHDSPVAEQLVGLLPVAGRDGTLSTSMRGTPAEGRMAAKTGTLGNVKALTGTQPGSDGHSTAFSLVMNSADIHLPLNYIPIWRLLSELIDAFPLVISAEVSLFSPLLVAG